MSVCQSHGQDAERYENHNSNSKRGKKHHKEWHPLTMVLLAGLLFGLLYLFLRRNEPRSKKPQTSSCPNSTVVGGTTATDTKPQSVAEAAVQYEIINTPNSGEGPTKDIQKVAKIILDGATSPLSSRQKALLSQPKSLAQWKLVSEDPLVFFYRGKDENDVWQIYYQPDIQNYKLVHVDPSSSLSSEYSCYPGSATYPECRGQTSKSYPEIPTWALMHHDSLRNLSPENSWRQRDMV